jgi:HAE1 family hydrophobic/amphiphilic exporter-1
MALVKQLILILMLIIQLPAGLLKIVFRKIKYGDFVRTFSTDLHTRLTFVTEIWPDFLSFKSIESIYRDFGRVKQAYREKAIWVSVLLTPFRLIRIVFYVFKYVITVFLELIYRFAHAVFMFSGVIIYMFYLLIRLLFSPLANLVIVIFDFLYGLVERQYPKILRYSLNNSLSLIGFVVVLFVFSVYVVGPRLGSELIPEVHQGEFYLELTLPIGTPVEGTDERIGSIAERIEKLQKVKQVATVCGTDKTATADTDEGEHTARITVTLERTSNIVDAEEEVIARIRDLLSEYSGIMANIARPVLFSFKTPIEVHLRGFNLVTLQRLSKNLEARMNEISGVVDAKASLQRGNPEVQIFYNRQLLARYGLNVMNVASIVRNKIRGDVATEFKDEDRKIDILVRLREADKQSLDDLRRLVINPGEEKPISLQAVADIRLNEGPSEIRRVDQQRTAIISANLAPGSDLKTISEAIYSEIQKMNIPSDFNYHLAGQNEEMETSLNSLMMALGLAIFLVYIVMASQFESLVHPFVIIFTIPLALIGVILFLYILNIPLSIVVFLGLIMLAGIVVNNAIVLVDYINQLRERGRSKFDAIIEAGQVRLRPILMTTMTTVLGLLPMAVGLGDGAEIRTPMALTVIVGLITSTLLTLVVIPTVYSIFSRK